MRRIHIHDRKYLHTRQKERVRYSSKPLESGRSSNCAGRKIRWKRRWLYCSTQERIALVSIPRRR
jgi:hypothetical protein